MPLPPSVTTVSQGWRQYGQEPLTGELVQRLQNQCLVLRDTGGGAAVPPLDFTGVNGLPQGATYRDEATGLLYVARPTNGWGTTATSQAGANPLTWVVDAASSVGNPNLLDNPDFAIWQTNPSGSTVTIAPVGYNRIADRWRTYNTVASSTSVSFASKWLKVQRIAGFAAASAGNGFFSQATSGLIGRQVTVSGWIKAGTTATGNFILNDFGTIATPADTAGKFFTATFTLTADLVGGVWTPTGTAGADESYSFKEWKCEVGPVATPYSPPNPDVELMKAKRRLNVIPADQAGNGAGTAYATTKAELVVAYPEMLAAPTITITPTTAATLEVYQTDYGAVSATFSTILTSKTQAIVIATTDTATNFAVGYGAHFYYQQVTADTGII